MSSDHRPDQQEICLSSYFLLLAFLFPPASCLPFLHPLWCTPSRIVARERSSGGSDSFVYRVQASNGRADPGGCNRNFLRLGLLVDLSSQEAEPVSCKHLDRTSAELLARSRSTSLWPAWLNRRAMRGDEWMGMPSLAAVSWATCRGSLGGKVREGAKSKTRDRSC
eukprot:768792-Hanusia_phi.AAC.16